MKGDRELPLNLRLPAVDLTATILALGGAAARRRRDLRLAERA
jgi:hypothetical protein